MTIIYFLVNLAYVAAISRADIRNSGKLVAALFFQASLRLDNLGLRKYCQAWLLLAHLETLLVMISLPNDLV